jgi:16S rRNA (guanine(966)-N(2))-methyltransferase RsmD
VRIIAGRLKGRTIEGPKGGGVRPTSDSLRETLFNVLGDRVIDASFLDAFAGTGAVGLEALSRGASRVTFVESDRRTAEALHATVARIGVNDACMIVRGEFARARLSPFDIVWLDPPYEMPTLDAVVLRASEWVVPAGLVVLEHSKRREVGSTIGGLIRTRVLVAGDSALSFFAPAASGSQAGRPDPTT